MKAKYTVRRVKGTHTPKLTGMVEGIKSFALPNTKPVKVKGGKKK